MKNQMKRIISGLLAWILLVSTGGSVPVWADETGIPDAGTAIVQEQEEHASGTNAQQEPDGAGSPGDLQKDGSDDAGSDRLADDAAENGPDVSAEDTAGNHADGSAGQTAGNGAAGTTEGSSDGTENNVTAENPDRGEAEAGSDTDSPLLAPEDLLQQMLADMINDALVAAGTNTRSSVYFDGSARYAMIASNGRAVNFTDKGWTNRMKVEAVYHADSQKLEDAQAQFIITEADDQSGVNAGEIRVVIECPIGTEIYPMRTETANDYTFADEEKRYDKTANAQEAYIIKLSGDKGTLRAASNNRYATIDNGELRFAAGTSETAAEVFTFVKDPGILNPEVSIQHKATGKYIRTYGEDGKTLTADGEQNAEDTIFSRVLYGRNSTNTVGDRTFATADLISKQYGNGIKSVNWKEGPDTSKGLFTSADIKGGGEWESVRILANGDGTVSFKDSCLDQYFTVAANKELHTIAKDQEGPLTDNEKFIIHTELEPDTVTDLAIGERTENTLSLSWKNPQSLFSGIEIYQKKDGEAYTKIADVGGDIGGEGSYLAEGLDVGASYSFRFVVTLFNGTEMVSSPESMEVSAYTRAGVQPAVPGGVKLEEQSANVYRISWEPAQYAQQYQLQCAESLFGTYQDIGAAVAGTETVVQLSDSVNPQDKYSNYYRVIAINGGERSNPSEAVSLETEMFGDHTVFFAPTDDIAQIDKFIAELFDKQNDYNADAQFKGEQWQIYFKPGDYTKTACMHLGFYTSFSGLGKVPQDVKLNNIAIPAYLPGGALGGEDDNATCNFWRSAENLSVIETGNEQGKAKYGIQDHRADYFNWAVAQAAPLRRVYSTRKTAYDWNYGWASGGYVADCWIDNAAEDAAGTWSGQQFFTRNTKVTGNTFGTTLNNFFMGVEAANNLQGQGADMAAALRNNNGYTNWGLKPLKPGDDGKYAQQVVTEITQTPKISEKPFLFLDDGEYKIFVPAVRNDTTGISWGDGKANSGMGEGTSLSLDTFYIAKPSDTAAAINAQIAAGKNIYFTPGAYRAEEPIVVDRPNAILLGTGMTSIIPDNTDTAMRVGDYDGIRIEGLIFDAGKSSRYLLQVGKKGVHTDHASNPIILQDLFFRVGGTADELTKAEDALEINSDDVIGDHFWIWRADHGAGVEWYGNESKHGLIVNGDDVTCYALFNEHFQEYHTLWNGENGATYFYQNETCYDPISQEAWMSHANTTKGYSSYKVSNDVKNHYAVGLGIYNVFIYTGPSYDSSGVGIELDHAIEVPNAPGVLVENACIQTFANDGENASLTRINHIVNGVGGSVSSGTSKETGEVGESWSRKFLLYYNNGNAEYGKETDPSTFNYQDKYDTKDQRTQFIGTETQENIQAPADEVIYLDRIIALYREYSQLVESDYTKISWNNAQLQTALANALRVIQENGGEVQSLQAQAVLRNSSAGQRIMSQADISERQQEINSNCTKLEAAEAKLLKVKDAVELADSYQGLEYSVSYNPAAWSKFTELRAQLKKLLDDSENGVFTVTKDGIQTDVLMPDPTKKVLYEREQALAECGRLLEAVAKELGITTATAVLEKLREAYTRCSKYQQADYTADSWTAFQQAMETAKTILNKGNEAGQGEADDALAALLQAEKALVKGSVSTVLRKLKEAYDRYAAFKPSDYTQGSWTAFAKALAAAKALLDKGDGAVSQSEADAALAALNSAAGKLVLKNGGSSNTGTNTSLEELLALYNKYLNLNKGNYTTDSWAALQKALAELQALTKETERTQEQTDAVLSVLEMAVRGLVANGENDSAKVESVMLNKTSVTLNKGKKTVLTASISPVYAANQNVIWSSSNTAAATVDADGVVKAVAKGTAKITATTADGGKTAVCKVTVKVPAAKVTLNTTKVSIIKGKSLKIKAKMTPAGTTDTIAWTSSKPSVATVKGGKITAKKAGTAKITATSSSGKKAVCTVYVVKKAAPSTSLKLDKKTLTVKKGSWTLLRTILKPAKTTDTVKWKSSNASVAHVDAYGFVTGKKKGNATITAISSSGKKVKCKVTVK